jgi:hypothetical protein
MRYARGSVVPFLRDDPGGAFRVARGERGARFLVEEILFE